MTIVDVVFVIDDLKLNEMYILKDGIIDQMKMGSQKLKEKFIDSTSKLEQSGKSVRF